LLEDAARRNPHESLPCSTIFQRKTAQASTFDEPHLALAGPGYRVRMDTLNTAGVDRPNAELAASVDQALAIEIELGTQAAAAFLEARGAGFALTCRVLGAQARRRPTCQIGQVGGVAVPPPER
jgi:hypothetical protein